jgi:hypothetical protein
VAHLARIEHAIGLEQRAAKFVALAENLRALSQAIQRVGQLLLDDGALFLNH